MKAHTLGWMILVAGVVATQCGPDLPPDQLYEKGTEAAEEKDLKAAYKYFSRAAKKEPEEAKYHWAAARTARNPNARFLHTKAAWDNGMKTPRVLLSYLSLSMHTDSSQKLDFALSLFEQLPAENRTEELRAQLHQGFGSYDSSLAIRRRLYEKDPSPAACNAVAATFARMGEHDSALSVLHSCRKRKLLDERGYVMLASYRSFHYDFDAAEELFREAKEYGLYNSAVQLEHAGFLIAQGKLDRAEKVLADMRIPAKGRKDKVYNHRARATLCLIHVMRGRPDDVRGLASMIPPDSPVRAAERELYDAVLEAMADSSFNYERFEKLRDRLPPSAPLRLFLARAYVRAGKLADGVALYEKLPRVFLRSPWVLVEYAGALSRQGEDKKALATLSTMHRHDAFTKRSLEMFRDISFKLDMVRESRAAQAMLESKYGRDAGVKYTGAVLAVRAGEFDKALNTLGELVKEYPDEKRFEIERIRVLMLKGDYAGAVAACGASSAPAAQVAPLLARAHAKMGDTAAAEGAYEAALKEEESTPLMLAYAQFLLSAGKAERAAGVYRKVMARSGKELAEDGKANAVLLNNLAWALLQSESFDDRSALEAAEKAHEISPDNPHILDTYAAVLVKCGRYRKAVKVLKESTLTPKEPRLLTHLATAYEKQGEANLAVRSLQDALAVPDSLSTLDPLIDTDGIKARVEEIVAREEM